MGATLSQLETGSFDPPAYAAGHLPLVAAIFADRQAVAAEIAEDALAAGFRLGARGSLAGLLEDAAEAPGDVILIDCPAVDGAALAALTRIDLRASRCGAEVVVSTSLTALDDVFGCLDQSGAQILVAPSRAERVIALGRVLAAIPRGRVRELAEGDRLALLRLTEQVGQLAERIDRLAPGAAGGGSAAAYDIGDAGEGGVFRFESPRRRYRGGDDGSGRLTRAVRPALPDPRLVRRIIRQRQLRAQFFDGELFADPAWDILLDLTAARAEQIRVSVTSVCIASGVPPTTALRWIGQMTEAGLLERIEDEADRRRAFIALSERTADAMARYFAELGKEAGRLV